MSMPAFPKPCKIPTTEQALAAIITSIAMEETALSHIINAESEKIKFIVECAKEKGCAVADIEALLAVNKSASEVLKTIAALQVTLKEKFAMAVKHMPKTIPPCVSKFITQPGYIWHKNTALFLMRKEHGQEHGRVERNPCASSIRLIRRHCKSMILLPPGKNFEMLFALEAINKTHCPVKIAIEFCLDIKVVATETLQQDAKKIKMSHRIPLKSPVGEDMAVVFKLLSPESLSCVVGGVTITLVKPIY